MRSTASVTVSASGGQGNLGREMRRLTMPCSCCQIGLSMPAATSASMQQLPPAMAGVGSAVNDTTRNMGSVLGVATFGSITASVFASQMAHQLAEVREPVTVPVLAEVPVASR